MIQKIHEYGGFKVDRNELSKLFYIIHNNPNFKNIDYEKESGFGKNKIENLKYYLKNFNLLDKNYSTTELAKVVYTYDKYFEDEVTLWALFYHWAERSSNPFLFFLLNEAYGSKSKEELRRDFLSWTIGNEIKTEYDKKDFVGGLMARTLNALTDQEAFKSLNVFSLRTDKYSKELPYKMHPLIIAYVLYDNRHGRTTISFEELLKESNNIGNVFNLNRETLQQKIYAMRDVGLVQYVQTAHLHHIVYTFQETSIKLLERYYE